MTGPYRVRGGVCTEAVVFNEDGHREVVSCHVVRDFVVDAHLGGHVTNEAVNVAVVEPGCYPAGNGKDAPRNSAGEELVLGGVEVHRVLRLQVMEDFILRHSMQEGMIVPPPCAEDPMRLPYEEIEVLL